VLFANTVNDRRASWEMLGGALLCFAVITYKALPIRRHLLGKAIVGLVLISAVYFPVMWNSNSSLGEPARAIKSQIAPSARDADSDTYRIQENANLELNIKQDGLLGKGFGVKIDYALPITDISQDDPLIAYIPHNDVLDVLMRMGVLGGIAMWGLIAAAIISGFRLAMSKDRELAVIGTVVACSIVAYALMGAVDQGFFFFRIAFITGSLLGLAEAARRLARVDGAVASPPRERARPPATSAAAPQTPTGTGSRPLVTALAAHASAAGLLDLGADGELSIPVAAPGHDVASATMLLAEPVDPWPKPSVPAGLKWSRSRAWIWDASHSSWREGVVCASVALGPRRWIGYGLRSTRTDEPAGAAAPNGTEPTVNRLTWVSTSEVGGRNGR
jgi:hypothetical protein